MNVSIWLSNFISDLLYFITITSDVIKIDVTCEYNVVDLVDIYFLVL